MPSGYRFVLVLKLKININFSQEREGNKEKYTNEVNKIENETKGIYVAVSLDQFFGREWKGKRDHGLTRFSVAV